VTTLSYQQITGFAPPSLAPSSSSGPSGGSNIGNAISVDWSRAADAREVGNRKARRKALAKARDAVESRPQETKKQRLERLASNRQTYTGSNGQREVTRGAVAKAAASLANEAPDNMFADEDFRRVRSALRHKYPGADLGQLLEVAKAFEARLMSEPHNAYYDMVAAYSRTKNSSPYKEPVFSKGLRGSLERARIDQQDEEQLRAFTAKFGSRIPSILAEINAMDDDLRRSTSYEAAKISARFGAPAVPDEIPAYEQKLAVKEQQKAAEQHFLRRCHGITLAVEGGHLPGIASIHDEDAMNELAAVLQHPQFQHNLANPLDSLIRAAKIASHPEHKRITPRKGASKSTKRSAGALSITGGARADRNSSYGNRERGTGTTRDSIRRVRAVM
jgi:hypothetical protein